ncbi:hypothetical protein [Streptomyces sp. NPDC017991]|uniref:hypothetical protein n=1 Tax=Streptomyces sp. NPDC017991 TaxID=3365026 RepID=UPI00378F3CEA
MVPTVTVTELRSAHPGYQELSSGQIAAMIAAARRARDPSCAVRKRPMLCLVDHAQWLGAASSEVVTFLARWVGCEPVAMAFAARPQQAVGELDELPGLFVGGPGDIDALALLSAKSYVTLDGQVRRRLMAEARGNLLALPELPGAGGFAPPDTSSVPTRIEHGFRSRLASLPDLARLLLTVASAEPTGDPGLLWPVTRLLGIDVAEAHAAATGLVEFATRVRFCHPLARSTVYRAATPARRRAAHWALAAVTDPAVDPDRRAWHRAQAATGPDEEVAAELERSQQCGPLARRCSGCCGFPRTRGGPVAGHQQADRTAPDRRTGPARRGRHRDTAAQLLATVENAALDERQHARADLLREQIAFVRHNDGDGPKYMLRAARRLGAPDPRWSRACFLDALDEPGRRPGDRGGGHRPDGGTLRGTRTALT